MVSIFVDGSYDDQDPYNMIGIGIYSPELNLSISKVLQFNTPGSYASEILAIIYGLNYKRCLMATIYSDCESAIKFVHNTQNRHYSHIGYPYLTRYTRKALTGLGCVQLQYVNRRENGQAHKLANLARHSWKDAS
jgi:hypothetical protein